MKASFLFLSALLMAGVSASAATTITGMTIKSLSCAGTGLATGYTTIQLVEDGSPRVNISSLKYFQSFGQEGVYITQGGLRPDGKFQLDFGPSVYGMSSSLVLAPQVNGVSAAGFTTDMGMDLMSCSADIQVNVDVY